MSDAKSSHWQLYSNQTLSLQCGSHSLPLVDHKVERLKVPELVLLELTTRIVGLPQTLKEEEDGRVFLVQHWQCPEHEPEAMTLRWRTIAS